MAHGVGVLYSIVLVWFGLYFLPLYQYHCLVQSDVLVVFAIWCHRHVPARPAPPAICMALICPPHALRSFVQWRRHANDITYGHPALALRSHERAELACLGALPAPRPSPPTSPFGPPRVVKHSNVSFVPLAVNLRMPTRYSLRDARSCARPPCLAFRRLALLPAVESARVRHPSLSETRPLVRSSPYPPPPCMSMPGW